MNFKKFDSRFRARNIIDQVQNDIFDYQQDNPEIFRNEYTCDILYELSGKLNDITNSLHKTIMNAIHDDESDMLDDMNLD